MRASLEAKGAPMAKPKPTLAEKRRAEHRLDLDVPHRTAVRKASGRAFIAKCSCGWQAYRKYAVQAEATRDAIRHQQLVRQAATERGAASPPLSHPSATVRGSGMASAAR